MVRLMLLAVSLRTFMLARHFARKGACTGCAGLDRRDTCENEVIWSFSPGDSSGVSPGFFLRGAQGTKKNRDGEKKPGKKPGRRKKNRAVTEQISNETVGAVGQMAFVMNGGMPSIPAGTTEEQWALFASFQKKRQPCNWKAGMLGFLCPATLLRTATCVRM